MKSQVNEILQGYMLKKQLVKCRISMAELLVLEYEGKFQFIPKTTLGSKRST
jgi:hypothetical protein